MKYIKKFENIGYPKSAKVGDIVGCISAPKLRSIDYWLIVGDKYKIMEIIGGNNEFDSIWFNVQNIKNGKVYEGWGSQLFLPELEFDANKYNL